MMKGASVTCFEAIQSLIYRTLVSFCMAALLLYLQQTALRVHIKQHYQIYYVQQNLPLS